jgi:hypothetical protein
VEGLDEQGVELSGGVALEPSVDVEVGLGLAGPFDDGGLGAGVAEQPVDGDEAEGGVGPASPPRESRKRSVCPEEAGIGAVPVSRANAPSERSLRGCRRR